MPEQLPPKERRLYPKGPNFGMIVLLSGIAIVIIFILFYFFLGAHGSRMLPRTNPRNAEPNSQLTLPAQPPPQTNV